MVANFSEECRAIKFIKIHSRLETRNECIFLLIRRNTVHVSSYVDDNRGEDLGSP
jgi:hypothetical protein